MTGRYRSIVRAAAVVLVLTVIVPGHAPADTLSGDPRLVSIGPDAPGETGSYFEARGVSYSGRYVAFLSDSSDLVPEDGNLCHWGPTPFLDPCMDVYLKDMVTGALTQVSTTAEGALADANSGGVAISANGRYVAFETQAGLVPDDTNRIFDVNDGSDIYMRDMVAGTISRVSVRADGSQAGGGSISPSISADGTRIAFVSGDDGLVPGDANGLTDVFVYDRKAGETSLVSRSSAGEQANASSFTSHPAISPDGRYVVFDSTATNLAPGDLGYCAESDYDEDPCSNIYLRDLRTGTTTMVRRPDDDVSSGVVGSVRPVVSRGARVIAFVSDHPLTGERGTIINTYAYYRSTGELRLLTRPLAADEWSTDTLSGQRQWPSISYDGRRVSISSEWTLAERSPGSAFDDAWCYRVDPNTPSRGIWRDLRCVEDVYVYNEAMDTWTLGSVGLEGIGHMPYNVLGVLSGDGASIAFSSYGTGSLEDTDGAQDVYLHRL